VYSVFSGGVFGGSRRKSGTTGWDDELIDRRMARDIKRKVLPRNLINILLVVVPTRDLPGSSRVPSRPEFPIRISNYAKKK
jgi:hypothetical protein